MAKVFNNQTLFDIAILNDGTIDSAFDWALVNGLSITDDLVPEQILINPNSIYKIEKVADFFKYRNQNLGTAIRALNINNEQYGFPYGFPISF